MATKKGTKFTKEHRDKISQALKGRKTPWLEKEKTEVVCPCGKKFYLTPGQIRKGHGKYCSRKCFYKYYTPFKIDGWNKGKKMGKSHKKKLSDSRVKNGSAKGSKNPNWKGGLTAKQVVIRSCTKYKNWRKAVYERDDYKCVICGIEGNGKNLEAHHIIPLSILIKDKKPLFEISNGKTLCSKCHKTTDTYGWGVWNKYLKPKRRGV